MGELQINDLWFTFQGEGLHTGRRALFVRLPYCNLACGWCDSEFNSYKRWTERDFIAFASSEPTRFAVVTGGEPTLHKHASRVVELLHGLGYVVAVESNGTAPMNAPYDFVTVSPKADTKRKLLAPYHVDPRAMEAAHEFKYVVDRYFDFSVLDRHDTNDGRRYSLSPEWNEFHENLNKIFAYTKDHPGWRISLQTHKWIKVL